MALMADELDDTGSEPDAPAGTTAHGQPVRLCGVV
jgi:hypothetical protein